MLKPISVALDALSPEARAELLRPVQTYDPRAMELAPGVEPQWHVWEIASRDVEAELIKFRFGVYVPECEETCIRRGRKVDRRTVLFPGYVFVFVWPTDQNWSRIVRIRGIVRCVGTLTQSEIDQIRVMENHERPITLQYFAAEGQPIPKKRKRRRHKEARPVLVPDEIIRTRAWSAFDDIVHELDGERRSEALLQMLGGKGVASRSENQIALRNAPRSSG